MRSYLALVNLYQAAGLSAVVTLMAVGRIAQGQMPLGAYIPLTFGSMLFVAGAVTAWGAKAGMPGVVTDGRTLRRGLAVAAGLSLLALPFYLFGVDPYLRELLSEPRYRHLLDLTLPGTIGGRLSLILWSAGFQMMFLVAAPMSLFARLTQRRWAAILLCLVLRSYVLYRQMAHADMTDGAALFYTASLLSTAAGCAVFARFGLVPAMLLAAGFDVHVFL
jgi:hypothetical protein